MFKLYTCCHLWKLVAEDVQGELPKEKDCHFSALVQEYFCEESLVLLYLSVSLQCFPLQPKAEKMLETVH